MRVSMSTIQLSERLLQTILPENHDSNCLLGCKRRCLLGNSGRTQDYAEAESVVPVFRAGPAAVRRLAADGYDSTINPGGAKHGSCMVGKSKLRICAK